MIRTSMQLKAKISNIAQGDNYKSLILIRNFFMERFLERVSCSSYSKNFILKGGMLIASMVGLDTRATMDIDTTVDNLIVTKEEILKLLESVIEIEVDDGVIFRILKLVDIMEEHEYPGLRCTLEAQLDKLKQNIKIDISTGDKITPQAVKYNYQLMFENRSINLLTYNIETLLAEKLETIMSRGITNTRMRDFYDIYVLTNLRSYDPYIFDKAFHQTCQSRYTSKLISELGMILKIVSEDGHMIKQWNSYAEDSFYVKDLSWNKVMISVIELAENVS